jgi:hypothetical protein
MASRHGPRRCGRAEADSNRSRGAVAEDLMSKYCTVLYCTSVPLAIRRLRHSKDHLIEEPAQPACLQRTNRKSGRKTCIAGSISGCNRRCRCRCRCRRWQQWHSRPLSRCPYPLHRAITWAIPTYCIAQYCTSRNCYIIHHSELVLVWAAKERRQWYQLSPCLMY